MFAGSRWRLAALCLLSHTVLAVGDPPCLAASPDSSFGEEIRMAPLSLQPRTARRAEAMARVAAAELAAESDPALAEKHNRRALDLDPSNIAAAQELATAHLEREEIPEALAVLKDTFKQNPDSATVALRIAGIYLVRLRKFDTAERYARQALRAAPDSIDPYQTLYSIFRAANQTTEAKDILAQAARRKNNDPSFWANLGDLQELDERSRNTAAGEDSPALASYLHAAEVGQQDAPALLRAHLYFFTHGRFHDAVTSAQRLLVLQPSDTQTRERLAFALNALGRQDDAIAELNRVASENPASLAAYREHGRILLERGDYPGALEKFEKALLLNDEDPRLYLQIVELCLRSHNEERAVWWLSQAREKFTRLPDLPFYEGQILSRLNRWKEALLAFNVAADLAAKYQPSFLSAEFHFQRGVAAERTGDRKAAETLLREALALDANYAPALNYLGYMWAENGENLAEAEDFISRALKQEPDNAAYLDSLGWVLYKQGRYQEALPAMKSAVAHSDAPDSTLEEHLGDTYDKLGRRTEAIAAWERAMQLEGASVELPAKLQAARGRLSTGTEEAKAAPAGK